MIVRRLIVVVVALLLAAQVVRNAAVAALSTRDPAAAAKLWPDHPSVEISLALTQIGRASRSRRPIGPEIFTLMDDAATKAPLAPEPFLVEGVRAQILRDSKAARDAFRAAQWRDPRSLPAAYFLAQYYFRVGQPVLGLEQTSLLARLSPGGRYAVAPLIAAYAEDRSNWPYVRKLFRSEDSIEDDVLIALAANARNADAILALADGRHRNASSGWLGPLLNSLVASGDYARAHAIWSSVGQGQASGALLYDATFSSPEPPPPFNWTLASSTVGLAERQPGKRLHVIFYGNDDGALASELVLLPAGTYRLQMQIVGSPVHPESLRWSVRCDKSQEPLATIAADQAASRGWTFQVPEDCPAQWLELSGRSGDIAQQSDVTITGLTLTRTGANA